MRHSYVFADDFEIATMRGLRRVWHQPQKHDAVLVPDRPWEESAGCACPIVLDDASTGELRMWYWNSGGGLNDLYATSTDGLQWEKPILGLAEIDGTTENNKVATPGRLGPGAIYHTPEAAIAEGEDRVYRTMSWMPGGEWRQRYLPLFSADGLNWRTCPEPDSEPGISGEGVGDTGTFLVADDDLPMMRANAPGRYVTFPRLRCNVGRFGRRSVGMTYCDSRPDRARIMLEWPRPVLCLAPDLLDDRMASERLAAAHASGIIHFNDPADHHCEFYAMQPWEAGSGFFGALYVFDVSMNMSKWSMWNQHGLMETQLVWSRDLVHWERVADRRPWIGRGEAGTQDSAMVHFCSVPVRVGDRMYQYYSSGNQPHPIVDQRWVTEQIALIEAGKRIPMQAIGCVSFRPDGYVSLEAGGRGGHLETVELPVSGSRLVVNADVSEGGELRVSVLRPDGRRIRGFGPSKPITGDHIEAQVQFDTPLQQAGTETVRLRFELHNARLYSYEFV